MSELRSGLGAPPGDRMLAELGLGQPDFAELRRPPEPMAPPAADPAAAAAMPSAAELIASPEIQEWLKGGAAVAPQQPAAQSSVRPAPEAPPGAALQGPIGSPQRQIYPFGDMSVLDPVPPGRTLLMHPREAMEVHRNIEFAGGKLPPDPRAEFVLKGLENGLVYDQNFQPYRTVMGSQDPLRVAQQQQAASAGGTAGAAPTRPEMLRLNIGGTNVETPGSAEELAEYNRTGQLPARLQGLPGQAAGGGAAARPAVTPMLAPDYEAAQREVAGLKAGALNAQNQLTTLGDIRDLMKAVTTGNLAQTKEELGRKLIGVGMNADVVNRTLGNVADAQALQKAFWQLGTSTVVGNLGPGQAASTLEQGLMYNPNIALEPGAVELMTNILGQQARAQQDRYNAAFEAFDKPPLGGSYGPGGQYGAVTNAENRVNQRYSGENILRSAQLMTKEHHANAWGAPGSLGPTGPTPQSQTYIDLIPPGVTFYNPNGDAYRKEAGGKLVKVR